jgi:hypothetical protein
MVNPLKRLRSFVGSKRSSKSPKETKEVSLYAELYKIWPDGAWTMKWHSMSFADGDHVARGVILDTWSFEQREKFVADFGERGNWATMPDPIPAGWLPSERAMKALAAKQNWDTKPIHYMVGELTNLKHIRP